MKAQKLFYSTKIFPPNEHTQPTAVENHKRSNQTVVKENMHSYFMCCRGKIKEVKRKNCSISSRISQNPIYKAGSYS